MLQFWQKLTQSSRHYMRLFVVAVEEQTQRLTSMKGIQLLADSGGRQALGLLPAWAEQVCFYKP